MVHLKFVFLITMLALFTEQARAVSINSLRPSLFKIEVVSQTYQDRQPWRMTSSSRSSGSGFYIGDGRIMTNAHVVANATFITVLRDGEAEPQPAYVKFLAHDSDLAIITTVDRAYLDSVPALRFGRLPRLRSPVSAIGYPTGGEQVSVTQGVVSRIDYRRYVHSGFHEHLLIQVDSAINRGNSGGPVVQGQRVIGVAFQGLTTAENTGYVIPTPVINRFLADIASGSYDGHPISGLSVQTSVMVNEATVRYHGLNRPKGVKVSHLAPHAPFANVLEPGDVLIEIAGHEIGVDGKIDFQGERVHFLVVYDLRQHGDLVSVKYIRGRQRHDAVVEVGYLTHYYDQSQHFGRHPPYLVHGGLVFVALSRNYLSSWGRNWFREAPLNLRWRHFMADYVFDPEQYDDYVVYAGKLAAPLNAYVRGGEHQVLDRLNGEKVRGIAHLKQLLDAADGEYLQFTFYDNSAPIVLLRELVARDNEQINARYGVEPASWLLWHEVDAEEMKQR